MITALLHKGLVLCTALWVSQGAALSAPGTPSAPTSGVAAIQLQNEDVAFQVGKELRCPVCQGMPIAESPSSMAQDMMKRVREMVAEGKTREEILEFFVTRYGEWVLLKPKAQGMGWLVWTLPPVGLLIGLILIWQWIRSNKAASVRNSSPMKAAAITRASHASTSATPGGAGAVGIPESDDPYIRAVREQVEQQT